MIEKSDVDYSADSTVTDHKTFIAADGKTIAYKIHHTEKYGKYIDAADFGTDQSGKTDSLAAIKNALAAAHAENAAVYLGGKLYISDQIVINKSLNGVTALFGDGMGETEISFDKAQTGVFNSNSNEDDIRAFAGILVDGVNGVTVADLSVEYTNNDFYRKGQSYFGKVSGILVNDAGDTLISGVEVSGVNRAGVIFTSTETLTRDPRSVQGRTYKARLIRNEIDEDDANLPWGENNRIENSYLHNNRVAGALVSYQKNFTADGNTLSWNGHEADGGTGYGIATMAGSYNKGITFTNNYTDHNYRKGLDSHDGTDITIVGNVSNGDRLYGIAVYNRQFAMDKVKIADNTVIQDAAFRLINDDDLGTRYQGYSAIQLQTNTQRRDLHTDDAVYEITGNKISGLDVLNKAMQTYAIEFRNYEHSIDYTANITGNTITGEATRYLIAVLNDTSLNKVAGAGSGTINISGNTAEIGEILNGSVAVYVQESGMTDTLRGSVTVSDNNLTIGKSNGTVEAIQLIGNAETYTVTDNTLTLHGTMDKSIISILGRSGSENVSATVSDNTINSDVVNAKTLYKGWIETSKASFIAVDNTYNGKAVDVRSNVESDDLEAFQAAKAAADAKDPELTTVFDLEADSFNISSLFTAYDAAHINADTEHYEYAGLNDTFTINTEEHAAVI
ncbi:right-handed parallel beta-helix repeat-containing protein [Neisseria chenwenguii]|uniref:right-handed parallel beta-helix repeat-containing protein n=1 Tax=Neisseria chenwenguii TaxID=1853278 RepID=UPI001F2F518B|nr:right-handed parallel beta-helix repeat-containing protein [Neisseria chenwenguii]